MKNAIFFLLLLTACTPMMVRHDMDSSTSFEPFHTYSLGPRPGGFSDDLMGSPLVQKRLYQALDAELQALHYQRASAAEADLIVDYATNSRLRYYTQNSSTTSVTTTPVQPASTTTTPARPATPAEPARPATTTTKTTEPVNQTTVSNTNTQEGGDYEETRIVVSMTDRRTGDMVWQGWISGRFNDMEGSREAAMQQGVQRLMQRLPYEAGGRLRRGSARYLYTFRPQP